MTSGSEAASIPAGTKGEFNDFFLGWLGRPATLEEKANGYDYPWGGSYPGYSIQGTGDEHTSIPYKRTYKPYRLSQLYLMTFATAGVMGIDDKVGSFKEGMETDFVVTDMDFPQIYNWNKKVTEDFLMEDLSKEAEESLAAFKTYSNSDLSHVETKLDDYFWLEKAFSPLIVLSDDRTSFATYIMGKQAYDRELHYHLSLDDDYTFPMRGTMKGSKKSKGSKNGKKKATDLP